MGGTDRWQSMERKGRLKFSRGDQSGGEEGEWCVLKTQQVNGSILGKT